MAPCVILLRPNICLLMSEPLACAFPSGVGVLFRSKLVTVAINLLPCIGLISSSELDLFPFKSKSSSDYLSSSLCPIALSTAFIFGTTAFVVACGDRIYLFSHSHSFLPMRLKLNVAIPTCYLCCICYRS